MWWTSAADAGSSRCASSTTRTAAPIADAAQRSGSRSARTPAAGARTRRTAAPTRLRCPHPRHPGQPPDGLGHQAALPHTGRTGDDHAPRSGPDRGEGRTGRRTAMRWASAERIRVVPYSRPNPLRTAGLTGMNRTVTTDLTDLTDLVRESLSDPAAEIAEQRVEPVLPAPTMLTTAGLHRARHHHHRCGVVVRREVGAFGPPLARSRHGSGRPARRVRPAIPSGVRTSTPISRTSRCRRAPA